jgi:hypothetical protein
MTRKHGTREFLERVLAIVDVHITLFVSLTRTLQPWRLIVSPAADAGGFRVGEFMARLPEIEIAISDGQA